MKIPPKRCLLIKALYFCAKNYRENPFSISELDKLQNFNFNQLRSKGLIKKYSEKGNRKGGIWKVTTRGIRFCKLQPNLLEKFWVQQDEKEKYVLITQGIS